MKVNTITIYRKVKVTYYVDDFISDEEEDTDEIAYNKALEKFENFKKKLQQDEKFRVSVYNEYVDQDDIRRGPVFINN